jgi:DNA-binding beta-propeller fold protein YncE
MNHAKQPHILVGMLAIVASIALIFLSQPARADEPLLERIAVIPLKGPAGNLDHMLVDTQRSRLFVANQINNSLDIVDLEHNQLVRQVPGQKKIHGIEYVRHLNRIYLGNGESGVNILDGREYTPIKDIPMPHADNVHYHPKTFRVYVAHGPKHLAVIDAAGLVKIADIELPGPPEDFCMTVSPPRLFVNAINPSQVVVIDPTKNQIVKTYPIAGAEKNETAAIDESNHRLFIGCRKPPCMLALDSDSGKEVARVTIPERVDNMFYDKVGKQIYATCGEGFIAVIRQSDANHYELVAKIPTANGAKTSYFDASTRRLYVGVPKQPGKDGPEVWVYRTRS